MTPFFENARRDMVDECDKCDRLAVAFYSVPVETSEGEADVEDEQRCEEHRRDRPFRKEGGAR